MFREILCAMLAFISTCCCNRLMAQTYSGSPYDSDATSGISIDIGGDEDDLGPPPGNPFVEGNEGNWRVKRSYVLQVGRTQTRNGDADNVNLRKDGVYDIFIPFWNYPDTETAPQWKIENEETWTFTAQINHYNPFGGFEIENVNPLGIYAASLYGFNHTLPVSVGANSRYREIGFDSFEDYMYGRCANNHFSLQDVENIEGKLSNSVSHSGRYSVRLGPSETITLKRKFVDCVEDDRPDIIK